MPSAAGPTTEIHARSSRTLSTGATSRFWLGRRTVLNEISPVSHAAKLNQKFLIHFILELREACDSTLFLFITSRPTSTQHRHLSDDTITVCGFHHRFESLAFESLLPFFSSCFPLFVIHAGSGRIFCALCARQLSALLLRFLCVFIAPFTHCQVAE